MTKQDIEKWILKKYGIITTEYQNTQDKRLKALYLDELTLLEEILYLFGYTTVINMRNFKLLKNGKHILDYDF